ncbi:MAG: ABC transporter permease [Patescibacteria group bacterium]|nr:ABC transporter permease [Patescibacteria group bacterium]
MKLKTLSKIALGGLKTNRSRSLLTILGIVIGITAIMMVMSIGQGAQNLILAQMQGLGAKVIAVLPGRQPKGFMDILSIFSDSLKIKDVEALKNKNNVPHLNRIMPIVFGNELVSFGSQTYRATILGVSEYFNEIYNITLEKGEPFTEDDVKAYANVAVIGHKVKEQLFGEDETIGQKIKIKNQVFKVVGVIGQKGQGTFVNFDDLIIIPYTAAQQNLFGIKYYHRIAIEVDKEENVDITVEDIKQTLRESHNILDPEKDDFYIQTQKEAIKQTQTVTNTLKYFLAAVAAISLIVGGVGIMNIMLVSVTERTREIGLRKALGATPKEILLQFLLEAVFLTMAGGIIGIIFGAANSLISSIVLSKLLAVNWQFTFPIGAMFLGLITSALIGLIFGLYPARKAAKKSPIEALRYE